MKTASIRLALFSLAVLLFYSTVQADTDKWDAKRSSSPESSEELRALQNSITTVVDKTMPATVGLRVGSGRRLGAGSGVIVSEDGLILTAAHVIINSETDKPFDPIMIVLPDGTAVRAKALGANVDKDSGMVQITGKVPENASWPGAKEGKWPVAEMGKSAPLKEGQWLVSMGHPGGPKPERSPPVRVGRMVSHLPRLTALQTDCTLVGGDSGGPLFDLDGNVVGIHSRIGMFLTNNLHVPIDEFRADWDKLKAGELIDNTAKPDLFLSFQRNRDKAIVRSVVRGEAADKAGIKPGDVIVGVEDETVSSPGDFSDVISEYKPGQKLTIKVERDGKIVELAATLGRRASRKN